MVFIKLYISFLGISESDLRIFSASSCLFVFFLLQKYTSSYKICMEVVWPNGLIYWPILNQEAPTQYPIVQVQKKSILPPQKELEFPRGKMVL